MLCVTGEPLFCQAPAALHVCGCVPPAHCVAFGLHAAHDPLKQTGLLPEHAEPLLVHAPLTQSCGCAPDAHCVAPGLHTTHTPLKQVGVLPEHAALSSIHAPATQVWRSVGIVLLHRAAPLWQLDDEPPEPGEPPEAFRPPDPCEPPAPGEPPDPLRPPVDEPPEPSAPPAPPVLTPPEPVAPAEPPVPPLFDAPPLDLAPPEAPPLPPVAAPPVPPPDDIAASLPASLVRDPDEEKSPPHATARTHENAATRFICREPFGAQPR